MAERFLISLDPEDLENLEDGVDLKTLSYLDRILLSVKSGSPSAAVSFLKRYFGTFSIYCDATTFANVEDVISILNHGAIKVFVSCYQFNDIVNRGLLEDLHRLVVSFDDVFCTGDPANAAENIQRELLAVAGDTHVDIHVHGSHDWKLLNTFRDFEKRSRGYPHRFVTLAQNDRNSYARAVKDGHWPIVPRGSITTDSHKHPNMIPASYLITAAVTTDRHDGLFTTLVTDEYDTCLGLVYSSTDSIEMALKSGTGVYYSRSRQGIWVKGATSGDTQELVSIGWDCDRDALRFKVRQTGTGFCHLQTSSCFGPYRGLQRLQATLKARRKLAPAGSYTARLFNDSSLLEAKIMEESSELCEAKGQDDIASEMGDLLYFALTKCAAAGVSLEDVERNLDLKSYKVIRRKGDAKPQWAAKISSENRIPNGDSETTRPEKEDVRAAAPLPQRNQDSAVSEERKIQMTRFYTADTDWSILANALQRPSQRSTNQITDIVNPIIKNVRNGGDKSLLEYTHRFEKATSLTSPVLRTPFPQNLMNLPPETLEAIDLSFENIRKFHAAQKEEKSLLVETIPGVTCSRFSRPIERVGLYVPGGTAVLPSTALMLGVPAMVAGCKKIVIATPPRSDGTITPEIVYVAHKVGAESIVLAGGAQAVAALAYGTESVTKVDKILGPGNQFVTAGKMIVSNDTTAGVSIDMPAGPSEVLVVADKTAHPAFVASDLLSQAEHGADSQVVLIAVNLDEKQLAAIESELHTQASALPRVDIVRAAIDHSVTLIVTDIQEAMRLSNHYAPEHLILQVEHAEQVLAMVENAGSVFIGPWTPESVGDYSAGVNHSLPTYGYAKQYSGVNLASFTKHITSSSLTRDGLRNVGGAVMQLAKVEGLEAHRRAVGIRLEQMEPA
ncbi:MAG: hypothetical protein LQ342_000442 [Letrouitia transgressa]|nr:MAG: hypothetical protein LQ342_000442 [Letrouitia transgressa]